MAATGVPLTTADRSDIFERLNRHRRRVDDDDSPASSAGTKPCTGPRRRSSTFIVADVRQVAFEGPQNSSGCTNHARSLLPLDRWGALRVTFVIDGRGDGAAVEWRCVVTGRAERVGTVSTVDPDFPAGLFQPYMADKDARSKGVVAGRP